MNDEPRVLHLNDCAYVGRHLVDAARARGHRWGYLAPSWVRPARVPANRWAARAAYAPFVALRAARVARADVVHVHYATSVRLLRERAIPRRPYLVHLHGTDIREQWRAPQTHDEVQRACDGASHVYYTTPDLQENAVAARPDAEFMPPFVSLAGLPAWDPAPRPAVVFASRWDDVKGASANVELARELRRALPDAELVGLDWGSRAGEAAAAGVRLVPTADHAGYLRLLASAHVAVGQAGPALGVSELEVMAIGVPTAALGSRLPRPDDAGTPPVMEGALPDVVEQVRAALAEPAAAAERLGGRAWVEAHHTADGWVEPLLERYRSARG